MSKSFIIALILGAIIGYGTHSFNNFFIILFVYIVGRILYNVFTN